MSATLFTPYCVGQLMEYIENIACKYAEYSRYNMVWFSHDTVVCCYNAVQQNPTTNNVMQWLT